MKLLKKNKAKILAFLMTAAVAMSALPLFFGTDVSAAVLSSNALVSESDTKKAGYTSEKAFRDRILSACKSLDGVKYTWGGGGWNGIDCAGSVSFVYSVTLKTAYIQSTPGSYGNRTLSYAGGGNPDKYGFYRPGFAGIKSSFKEGLLKKRGITPTENKFSSFDTNGTKGIQNDEWITIINTYGFKPGDMILWWNDNNDKNNAQHITIYAGIENGVPMHWTASSTTGYFCKKSLSSSSSEAGKGSFTGFMGLKATGLRDSAFAGFYLDKRDPSGINYLGAVFTVYKDSDLKSRAGELRDDDGDGVYTDYYALSGSSFSKQSFTITPKSGEEGTYEDTLYIKETTKPSGVLLPDGSKESLKDADGNIPSVYSFLDPDVYVVHVKVSGTDGSKGKLEYSVKRSGGNDLYSFTKNDYPYTSGSNVMLITNMSTTEETNGRGKGAGLFTDGSSLSLEKATTTSFDITTTVFTVTEGTDLVATYKYADGTWNWYDAFGNKWEGTGSFPIKYDTEYVVTETFEKDPPFECIDGNTIDYEYKNDSGWEKVNDTTYKYKFKTDSLDSKKTYSFTCVNNKLSGKLEVDKEVKDKDDSKEGCVFELWNKDKTIKLAEGVSDKDGKVRWKTQGSAAAELTDVPGGGYVLCEVCPDNSYHGSKARYVYEVPEGFTDGKDGKWYKEITVTTDILKETVVNDRLESSVKVVKSSEDKVNSNVEFSITYGGLNEEPVWDNKPLATGKTDSNGNLVFANLPTGWYRVDEKVEPAYKVTWDDGTAGKSRIFKLTKADDNKVKEVKATNKIDIKPSLSTSLTDNNGSHKVSCGKDIELTDKVHFENLTSGYEYKITGCLVDKTSGEILKDKDGKEYKTTVNFKADKSAGEISLDEKGREVVTGDVYVKFKIDSGLLFEQAFKEGKAELSAVCTETLYFRDIVIAEHKDLNDEEQTISISPKISTSATDANTNTSVMTLSETIAINDSLSFTGLNPGDKYIATGTLMDKATGEPYVDSDGNSYRKTVRFTPQAPDGYVIVPFENVKVPLDMIDLVVFESVKTENGTDPIAVHEDINDEGQTVRRPSCKTLATTVKGDKTFLKNSTVTIVDHVSYENLEVGHTYYAKATLKLSSGSEVTSKGTEVVSMQKFEPEETSGVVDVKLKFKAQGLNSGDTVVVIENIYDMSTEEETALGIQYEDIRVISHEDLDNKDQSLSVTDIPISGELLSSKTVIGAVIFLVSVGAGAYFVTDEIKRKRIKRNIR